MVISVLVTTASASIAGALTFIFAAYFILNGNQHANDPGGTHSGDIYGSSSSNPCDDFYEYACSNWKSQNPLSNEIDSITTFTKAQEKIDEYIWKLVSDDSYSGNDPRLQAASKFYKSCTNYRSSDTFISACRQWIYMYFGQWDFLPSLSQKNEAPNIENMDLTDFCLPAIIQFGSSPLFSLTMDAQTRSISISQGSLSVDLTTDEAQCTKSKKDFSRTANELEILESYETELDTAFQLMKKLSEKSSQSEELKRNTTLEELSSICPEIRWSYLFAKVFKEVEYEDYEGLPITIEGEEQLKQRCKQHESALRTDRATYQTMMIINFVSGLLKYTLLPSNKETTDPSTSHSQPHFDVDCLTELMEAFAYTLTRYYIPAHVNETHKKEVTTMFEELRKTVLKSIPKYNWLTVDQKKFVLKKIEKTKIHALYTDLSDLEAKENNSAIYKYTIEEDNYYWNLIQILKAKHMDEMTKNLSTSYKSFSPLPTFAPNLYYRRLENRVYVNAELIQPPFYIDGGDMLSNYGRIGFLIGHELFHAIDIAGVSWDEEENIQHSEFFVTLSELVFNQTVCFQDQYGRFEATRHKIARIDCQNEIIADNGALHASFKTYKKLLRKLAGHVSQDPDTTRKHDQSFFRNFTQILCGEHRGKGLDEYIYDTPYVLEKNRVNTALSNSVEFAEAYHCPIGSPMNPPKRCRVY